MKKPMKPRNPFARAPIMKKGGIHQKSRSSEQRQEKDVIDDELQEWKEEEHGEDDLGAS